MAIMALGRIRLTALVPLLLSLTAFILPMLCIFAGSKTGYLESANLLTLNTSMLGQSTTSASKPSSSSSALNTIGNDAHKATNKVVTDVTKELDLHDFYSVHILDYCEGFSTPSAVINATSHPSKNVTHCSNQTAFFHFDPTAALQKELKHGVNLTELQWPSAVQETIGLVELSSKATFLFYCAGATTAGFTLVGALVALLLTGRLFTIVNFMISMLAFFTLMIASAIATAIINQVVDAINNYGSDAGISATKGMTFISMTWAADILVLLNGFVWAFEFIKGRRGAFD